MNCRPLQFPYSQPCLCALHRGIRSQFPEAVMGKSPWKRPRRILKATASILEILCSCMKGNLVLCVSFSHVIHF
ncbi:hypothetical protein FKM82_017087 [Ascaphus truei]